MYWSISRAKAENDIVDELHKLWMKIENRFFLFNSFMFMQFHFKMYLARNKSSSQLLHQVQTKQLMSVSTTLQSRMEVEER